MGAHKTISVGLACGLIQLPSDTHWNLLMLRNQRNFSSGISSILPPEGNISRGDAQRKSDGRQSPGKSSQCAVVQRISCLKTSMVVRAVDQFSPTEAASLRRRTKPRNVEHRHVFKSKPVNAYLHQMSQLLHSACLPL